ncbi:MAG: hypothetical protein V3T65_05490, partial [Acidobacteriota bacterium]
GGGRDVLSALTFDQKSVLAVEINEDILGAVNGRFGEFTGHLDQNPKVTFVNDEARSYISRQQERFDIIQVSLIDTWAATAAGALVLTENSLYTLEAWKLFLERLTPRGVLSFSRWYHESRPSQFYRLTALATTSLLQSGVSNPRDHIVIIKKFVPPEEERLRSVSEPCWSAGSLSRERIWICSRRWRGSFASRLYSVRELPKTRPSLELPREMTWRNFWPHSLKILRPQRMIALSFFI